MPYSRLSNRLLQLRVRHLTLLERIDALGSLSAVAEQLSLTQPSVTGMLHELEAAFQTPLVERDRQGARLTAAGLSALTRLRLALNTLSGLEKDLAGPTDRRHLRIGVLSNAMLRLVPQAIAALHRQGMNITFEFRELSVEELIGGLLDNSLDCAIGRVGAGVLATQEQARLYIQPLREDPLVIVSAPNHPLASRKRVLLRELHNEGWVLLPPGTQSRLAFDQAFIQEGLVPPEPLAESLSFYSNFHLVNRTALLTTVPASTLSYLSEANLVRPVAYRWPIRLSPLMFLCLKSLETLPSVAAFRQAVMQENARLGTPPLPERATPVTRRRPGGVSRTPAA